MLSWGGFSDTLYGGLLQKCRENSFFTFSVSGLDVQGHVTSSFKVKMAPEVWMEEETEYIFLMNEKEKHNNFLWQQTTSNK